MAFQDLVDSVRSMIVSHREHDEEAFRHGAEAIIRSLTVQNRPGEARSLREALRARSVKKNLEPLQRLSGLAPVSTLNKHLPGIISFVQRSAPRHLVLPRETQNSLDRVIRENRFSTKLAEAGLTPRRKLLFWGPPGCGKTATAQWLAHELGVSYGVVRLASLITSYVGETGSNIQKVLEIANHTPMVLLIDEADAIAKSRDDTNDVGELRRVVNSLLQALDSFSSTQSIVILASNHSHLFDNALWRRFDDIVEFPLPTQKDRLLLLKHLTGGLKLKGSLASLATAMNGCSFAEVERAVFEVAKITVIENRASASSQDILKVAQQFKRKVSAATIRKRRSPSR